MLIRSCINVAQPFFEVNSTLYNVSLTLFQRRGPTLFQRLGTLKNQRRILFHFQRRINGIFDPKR